MSARSFVNTYILWNVVTQYNTVLHIDTRSRVLLRMGSGFQRRDIAKVNMLGGARG